MLYFSRLSCLILLASVMCASSVAGQGAFGQRYIEVEGGMLKSANVEGARSSVGLGFNFPLAGNFDAALGYSYIPSFEASVVQVGLAAHMTVANGLRPFIAVTAARQSVKGTKHKGLGVSAGVEFPLGESMAVRPSVAYSRLLFEDDSPSSFVDAGAAVTSWVTERLFLELSAGYGWQMWSSSRDGTWSAALGLGLRF